MDLKLTVSIDTDNEEYNNLPKLIASEIAAQLKYQPIFINALNQVPQEIEKAKRNLIEGMKAEVKKYDLYEVTSLFNKTFREAIKNEIKTGMAQQITSHLKTDREFIMQVAMALVEITQNKPE